MKQHLAAAAALCLSSGASWGAYCSNGNVDFGVVSDTGAGPHYTYNVACSVLGLDTSDIDSYHFVNRISFTLARTGDIFGDISLNPVRSGPGGLFPPGQMLFMITTGGISLLHDGEETVIGGELPGQNEQAMFGAWDLEAGDYTLLFRGRVFDTVFRSGFYDGSLAIRYDSVAAPVPEPAALALMAVGAPWLVWRTRRRGRS